MVRGGRPPLGVIVWGSCPSGFHTAWESYIHRRALRRTWRRRSARGGQLLLLLLQPGQQPRPMARPGDWPATPSPGFWTGLSASLRGNVSCPVVSPDRGDHRHLAFPANVPRRGACSALHRGYVCYVYSRSCTQAASSAALRPDACCAVPAPDRPEPPQLISAALPRGNFSPQWLIVSKVNSCRSPSPLWEGRAKKQTLLQNTTARHRFRLA